MALTKEEENYSITEQITSPSIITGKEEKVKLKRSLANESTMIGDHIVAVKRANYHKNDMPTKIDKTFISQNFKSINFVIQ
jgi:hypothetical protein